MNNTKKVIIFLVILTLIAVGLFLFWEKQQEELININNELPEGIKVVKNLMGGYKITNKIDNYSFKAPEEWEGIKYVEYIPKKTEKEYVFSTLNIEGEVQEYRGLGVSKFATNSEKRILNQAITLFDHFGLEHDFKEKNLNNLKVVVDQNNPDLTGMDTYVFSQDKNMYVLTCGSPEFIEEIILNGKW